MYSYFVCAFCLVFLVQIDCIVIITSYASYGRTHCFVVHIVLSYTSFHLAHHLNCIAIYIFPCKIINMVWLSQNCLCVFCLVFLVQIDCIVTITSFASFCRANRFVVHIVSLYISFCCTYCFILQIFQIALPYTSFPLKISTWFGCPKICCHFIFFFFYSKTIIGIM